MELTKSCQEEERNARCVRRRQTQVGTQEMELEVKDNSGPTSRMGCCSEKVRQCRQLRAAGSSCT